MSSTLRILHCLRAPAGGLFRHVHDLALGQAQLGAEVGIVCDSRTEGDPVALGRLADNCVLGADPHSDAPQCRRGRLARNGAHRPPRRQARDRRAARSRRQRRRLCTARRAQVEAQRQQGKVDLHAPEPALFAYAAREPALSARRTQDAADERWTSVRELLRGASLCRAGGAAAVPGADRAERAASPRVLRADAGRRRGRFRLRRRAEDRPRVSISCSKRSPIRRSFPVARSSSAAVPTRRA